MKIFIFAFGILFISTFCRTKCNISEAKFIHQSTNRWTPQPNAHLNDYTKAIFGKRVYISGPSPKGNMKLINRNIPQVYMRTNIIYLFIYR